MLTIFSTPKPFRDHIKVIQTNAIRSWIALRPACEIILFDDKEGTAEIDLVRSLREFDQEPDEHTWSATMVTMVV